MGGEPAAFMSYVRFNDQHDDGLLSEFRERLAAEVRAQTGVEFPIFQDRNDIAWGQNWQERIDQALDAVTLLLVVVTPSLFRSPACREEFARFREREKALNRTDLILPVYYIGAREIDDPLHREGDEMARVLAERQHADWRELRFEPSASPVKRRAVAQLATRMRDVFWEPPLGRSTASASDSRASFMPIADSGQVKTQASTVKSEPPTHVVDAYQRGDFATIGAAIKAAKPGDRILVRPGLYEEGLVIDKPLEVLGDGPVSEIVVRSRGADVVLFKASIGRIANLTLRQAGGGKWYGVDISQGRLDLEGCDISSESLACVAIRNGADPRIRGNCIHDGAQSGVYIYNNGLGTLEGNDIFGNATTCISIQSGGNPAVRRNQLHDAKQSGVYVYENGLGAIEDNDISGHATAGVAIGYSANPTIRRNRIRDCGQDGISVFKEGRGLLEENDISESRTGVAIREQGDPIVRRNRIWKNRFEGVWISKDGRGTIEDNDLTGNKKGAWDIDAESLPNVKRARNKD